MAIIGLIAWLFFFKLLGGFIVYIDPDQVSRLAERLNSTHVGMAVVSTIRFVDQHPLSALAIGPLLMFIGGIQGSWSNTKD